MTLDDIYGNQTIIFSANVIYTSRAYATTSVSVCLSVTEVNWRIIANLVFKFRSPNFPRIVVAGSDGWSRFAIAVPCGNSSRPLFVRLRLSRTLRRPRPTDDLSIHCGLTCAISCWIRLIFGLFAFREDSMSETQQHVCHLKEAEAVFVVLDVVVTALLRLQAQFFHALHGGSIFIYRFTAST